jgi:hypothetical protein
MAEYITITQARVLAEALEGVVSLLQNEIDRGAEAEGATLLELAMNAEGAAGDFVSWCLGAYL